MGYIFDVPTFHWADYLVFGLFLAVSVGIGMYYGLKPRKQQQTAKDFLTGGGDMHFLPVSLSMMASFLSAIFVLGIPAEMYFYGTTYSYIAISYFTASVAASFMYLPVYYKLKVTSGYEYLEHRFNKTVRTISALTFSAMMILYMSVVLYTPALALSQVAGLPMMPSILSVGAVVTFYTAMGGMKATIWNDAFQMVIVCVGFLLQLILGAKSEQVGGFGRAWELAENGSRIRFNEFDPDPLKRASFWTQVVGGTFVQLTLYASSQAQIQKFISCRSIRHGQIAVILSAFITVFYLVLVTLIGITMYAYFIDCDPLASGRVEKNDQLIPLYVMEVMGNLHGLPGLFLATTFSASLSSVSAGVNSLSAVFLEDIFKPIYARHSKRPLGIRLGTIITKSLAIFFGLLTIALAFLAEYMGELVLQIANSIFGMVGAPVAGVITLGMLFPCANAWGAIIGLLTSLAIMLWIGLGAIIHHVVEPTLPTSVEGCPLDNVTDIYTTLETLTTPLPSDGSEQLAIYRLSYYYYAICAILIVIIVGLPISLLTGGNKKKKEIKPELLYQLGDEVCCCCPLSCRVACRCGARGPDDDDDEKDNISELIADEKDDYFAMEGSDNIAYIKNDLEPPPYTAIAGEQLGIKVTVNVISYTNGYSSKADDTEQYTDFTHL